MIRVVPKDTNTLYIQWAEMDGEYFTVLRSTSPADGFEKIAVDLTTPFYEDSDVNLMDGGLRYFYKIKGFEGGIKVSESEGTPAQYNKRDPIANVVIHESNTVLRVMNNPHVKVLLKRRDGKRCPECWNPVTKKRRFSDCTTCNGTGVVEGYHVPITTRISRDFSQLVDNTSMMDSEKVDSSPVHAWIVNTPLVSPGDIIADYMDQRFLIERVTQRTKSQYVIRQLLDIIPLEKGHPVYNVEIDWSDVE